MNLGPLAFAGIAAVVIASTVEAQTTYSPGRWKFGEGVNGDLAAQVWTEIGYGITVALAFQCNEKGRYSYVGYEGAPSQRSPELIAFVDSYVAGDLKVETYRAGARTSSFRLTGFHEGEGDPVTDARLRSLQESDFIIITGGKRPLALPSSNANTAIAQYIAACAVLRPK